MHIQTFFERITDRSASTFKRDLLGLRCAEAARLGILDTFLADEAFDQYFSQLLVSPLSRVAEPNYILCALLNFGVHQLTMRRFPFTGSQVFAQVGCLDGHEFVLSLLRTARVEGHLVTAGNAPVAYDEFLPVLNENWYGKPQRFDTSVAEYLAAHKPCIGLLALVNLGSVEAYLKGLLACWPALHTHADVVIQGTPSILGEAVRVLRKELPRLPVSAREFVLPRNNTTEAVQQIAVFPKVPHDYTKLSPGIPAPGPFRYIKEDPTNDRA